MEKCIELCLTFYFYWVNFSALSRGTAICGMVVFHALFIATGYLAKNQLPAGKQLDWEAITTPVHTDFINRVRGWLNIIPLLEHHDGLSLNDIPRISEHVNTIRKMIKILNAE